MKHFSLISIFAAACAPIPEATTGYVYQFNGSTVTIEGRFSPDGSIAKPTLAMTEQAKSVCPEAQYLSARSNPDNLDTFLYLYKC